MYNSREIGELRADVAVNCRTLIERAAARGLPVLVVSPANTFGPWRSYES